MKNKKNTFRISLLALVLSTFSFYTVSAQAGLGLSCDPLSGAAATYENTFVRDLLSEQNVATSSFYEEFNGGQQSYQISCNCTDSDAKSNNGLMIMYSLKTSLPVGHRSTYYKLNDHIDVLTEIKIPNVANLATVPTSQAISDGTRHRDSSNTGICKQQVTQDTLTTGSQGKLTFYITTPFVGQMDIPRTEIARIYASASPSPDTSPPLGTPVAIVYLTGTLTVPQSCEINQGEIISVYFGSIQASNFTTLNAAPDNYRPVTFDIKYDCTKNGLPTIPSKNKLLMVLEGNDVQNQYQLVARRRPSDNKADIGIIVEDSGGTFIPFTQGILPMSQNGQGKLTLITYPINLVGGELETGEFNAMATLKIDIK